MGLKVKIELTEHTVKKIALESLIPRANIEDYEGYFYLDEFGSPTFVIESKK